MLTLKGSGWVTLVAHEAPVTAKAANAAVLNWTILAVLRKNRRPKQRNGLYTWSEVRWL